MPTPEEIAAALIAQVRRAHPGGTPRELVRHLRQLWQEGCDGLGDALEAATAAARAAERERAQVAEARARWVEAWPALLDLAELNVTPGYISGDRV